MILYRDQGTEGRGQMRGCLIFDAEFLIGEGIARAKVAKDGNPTTFRRRVTSKGARGGRVVVGPIVIIGR